MLTKDLTIEVRDRSLARIGQILPKDLDFKAVLRWCNVGEWTITLPGNHPMVPALRTPGSGVIVSGPTGVLFSGPTLAPNRKRNLEHPDGTLVFKGVTDEIQLQDALAFPSPAQVNPASQTAANDVRTGNTETLMRAYVEANLGPTAPAGRKRGFRNYVRVAGADTNLGVTTTKSPRFQNLLELCQELAVEGTVGFRVVQEGSQLQFQIVPVRDLRQIIRMDLENGTIIGEEVEVQGPSLTYPIIAGQGEGVARQMVVRTRPTQATEESEWGRAIERFYDRRDTAALAELQAKGDEELQDTAGGTSAKLVPTDSTTMRYVYDWNVGDWITVVVDGLLVPEQWSVVTEAVLLFNKSTQSVGIGVGDVTSFDPRDVQAKKQGALDSRVGYLERSNGGPISVTQLPPEALPRRGTTAQRDAFYGTPTTDPQRIALANQKPGWFNTDTGWDEVYYATTGTSGLTAKGLITGVPHGWYPVTRGPFQRLQPSASFTTASATPVRGWNGTTERNGGAAWLSYNNTTGRVLVSIGGRYEFNVWTTQFTGSGTSQHQFRQINAGTPQILVDGPPVLINSGYYTLVQENLTLPVLPGKEFDLYTANGGIVVHQGSSTSVRGEFSVTYIGPALVSD